MHMSVRLGLITLALCASLASHAQESVPPPLRDWQSWVLKGEEFRRCPFLASSTPQPDQPVDAAAFRCVWPERLTLAVDARGGTFSQRWQVFAESWVTIPGSLEYWPLDVRVNGAPAPVVAVDGAPTLRLQPGTYAVTGRFTWSTRPESLPMPDLTALIDLSVDNQRVAQPERPGGAVWLGKRRSAEQPAAMEVQVYRLLRDQVPAYLFTRIRLNVSGDAREELLSVALPDGFTPLTLTGDLPARLERDGRLRVQVRAGSHEINLIARAAGVAGLLSRPDAGGGKWAREEVWSFEPKDSLRVAAAEGAEGIDPIQANVPPDWQRFPAFRMAADSKLNIVERSRGLANADDNRLRLNRNLWLDFDHEGYTAVDTVSGTMRRDWRLDMAAPFRLESAAAAGEPLLVTAGASGHSGLEVRTPQINLTTVARIRAGGALPATGWIGRFDGVDGVLHLPPGHRLIAAIGADDAPQSWFERWGLWSVFGVLIVVVFVYWTGGIVPASIAAVAFLLTYQEEPAYIWIWGNLLAALAIARAAPEGRFRKIAHGYRTASFGVLALALLPFLWMQVRLALYPQLENQMYFPGAAAEATYAAPMAPPIQAGIVEEQAGADAAAPAAVPAPMLRRDMIAEKSMANAYSSAGKLAGLNTQNVVQRYASGTRLQAGPGIPAWRYNSYDYHWSGPVEAGDTVRFLYLGPITLFFWRIFGVAALAVLFLWLARLSYGGTWRLPGMPRVSAAGSLAAGAPLLVAMFALGAAAPASAQQPGASLPDAQLLEQLKQRLIAAPKCAPQCAEISGARVVVDGQRLEITLSVSALANVAVAMPHASDRWQLDDVAVDARASLAMARENDSTLWVPLTPGAHVVRLAGRLAPAESIQVAFPQPPRAIEVSASGWTVSGMNEGRLVSGTLELARERGSQRTAAGDALETGTEFAAFVRVERVFNLDLDWTLQTTVTRIAPLRAAVSVEIPLVKGESVLTPGVEVRDGTSALVGLGTGEPVTQWQSGLARAETLEVSLPEGTARAEVWSFVVNPQWHVEFEGFPPVLPEDATAFNWVFRFIPRPGEKLVAHVTRPKGVEGATLAIDSVAKRTTVGKRSANTTLGFTYRSTQGGRHIVKLPAAARVTAVRFDNQPVPVRPEKGELPLSLSPGKHTVEIDWDESGDVSFLTHPPTVELGSPASNIRQTIEMPTSRWPLFAAGKGVGPAVLYWGELAVFIAIAWFLGRWKHSPLKFHEWLLLGLGLSTQSWWVFSFTAAWLFTMRWRERWQPGEQSSQLIFNLVQVALVLFTVLAISTLVFSGIRNGMLSAPDMGVTGAGSGYGRFEWFQDQTTGTLESPSIYSVPILSYRLLIFAWAIWMAFALVGWLRWAFNAWKTGGLWRADYAGVGAR
jgi:hypothetical protein